MSYPVREKTVDQTQYGTPDSLLPMRELIERQKGLRPVVSSGPTNPNNLVERDVRHLPPTSNAEASPAADPEGASIDGRVALVFGAATVVGTAATAAYNWWFPQEPVAPVSQPLAAPSNNEAPPVNMFLPRDADEADLAAIEKAERLARLTDGDAALAERLANEEAEAAAAAKRQKDAQIAADLRRAQFSQELHNLAIKK